MQMPEPSGANFPIKQLLQTLEDDPVLGLNRPCEQGAQFAAEAEPATSL